MMSSLMAEVDDGEDRQSIPFGVGDVNDVADDLEDDVDFDVFNDDNFNEFGDEDEDEEENDFVAEFLPLNADESEMSPKTILAISLSW